MSAEAFGSLPAWRPLCMDAEELARWSKVPAGHVLPILPCADCLVGFAAEMRAVGRCNGSPGGVEEDEEMDQPASVVAVDIGVEPYTRLTRRDVEAGLPKEVRRVALEVTAPPCGSCAHEPVCALRTAFEGMATVETSAPPLPDGLRLALVATVECSHFLRDRAKPAPVRVLTSQERGQANGAGAHRSTHEWTPEQRAAQGDRMRARNLAARPAATS